jgi:putative transposase
LLVLLIEGLALRRPPQRVAAIHRTVADIALEQDWPVPSYSTVYAIVAVLNPGLRTLGPAGHQALPGGVRPDHRREAKRPNDIWQVDHTQLDLWVRLPSGKPARSWRRCGWGTGMAGTS